MSDKLIKETTVIYFDGNSNEAGLMESAICPNCNETVKFADCQWWRSECDCGEWELNKKAVLYNTSED